MSLNADTEVDLDPERIALIRSHLREVLESRAFEGGTRARQFLELVIEHALAGRYDDLRERMIGAEMFGRPVNYDTANDAVVRVKATEVRRKLAQYYQERKEPSRVRITLPAGSYVPKFLWETQISEPVSSVTAGPPVTPEPEAVQQSSEVVQAKPLLPNRKGLLLFSVAALLTFIASALYITRRDQSKLPAGIRSIAVLPLRNLSGDTHQEYFADAMTEELIAELGQVAALRVISRTSAMTYKGSQKTLPQIAHELSVDAVVEGSVLRDGNRIRITAQLIDARTDQHIWAKDYVRDVNNVFTLQGEVAQAIANEISIQVTPEEQTRLARVRTVDPETQKLYLQGMQSLNGGDPRNAIVYLQQAVAKDPNFAPSHAALANSYGWIGGAGWMPYSEAFPKEKAEAEKAISLDDALPEGHVELANAAMNLDWDWATQEKEYKRALDLNPNSASLRWSYAFYLERRGNITDALAQSKIALELDPVSSRAYMSSAFTYYFAGQYDDALTQMQRAADLPHSPVELPFPLGDIYAEKGLYPDAIEQFQKLGDAPHALGHMGNAYARSGNVAAAKQMVVKLESHIQNEGIGRYEVALIYVGLGKKDEAFQWLNQAYKVRDKGLTYIKIDPCLDPLRSDPRFKDLERLVGIP